MRGGCGEGGEGGVGVGGTDSIHQPRSPTSSIPPGQSLTDRLVEKQNEFDDKFERCFNLNGKVDSEAMLVGKAAFGNLLGGIGYFYGQSKISLRGMPNPKSRRDILLEYVKNVQPEFMELFIKRASQQVVDAMRQTVTNMIGTLPPQFFAVTVTTVAENLAQLMYNILMTGYMFRNVEFLMELEQRLDQVSLPDVQGQKETPYFAPGTQKKVLGEVIRWSNVSGPEKMDAMKYIELLEAEIEELNRQVARNLAAG